MDGWVLDHKEQLPPDHLSSSHSDSARQWCSAKTCCHLRLRSPTAAAGSILAPAPHNSSSSSSSCCCCWSELSYVTRLPMPDAYSSRQPPSSSSMRNTDRNTYQDKPFPPPTTCWFDGKIGLSQGCHWCLQQRQQHPRSHLLWSNSLCVLRALYWRRNKSFASKAPPFDLQTNIHKSNFHILVSKLLPQYIWWGWNERLLLWLCTWIRKWDEMNTKTNFIDWWFVLQILCWKLTNSY